MTKRIKISEGEVLLRDKKYKYEFYSDNKNVYVKIFHPGMKGDVTVFKRNDSVNLKSDMDQALETAGMFS